MARVWCLGLALASAGCQGDTSVDEEDGTTDAGSTGSGSSSSGAPTSGGVGTDESSGGSEDDGGSSSTGEPDCPDEDRPYAPPPVMVDGELAVPIDVLALAGEFTIDFAAQTTRAHAELRFRVGPVAGRPIFDLRQEGVTGSLDGAVMDASGLPQRDLGGGPGTEMRVLAGVLPACSEHVLVLDYPIEVLVGYAAPPPVFKEDGVAWDFGFSDLTPRTFLEQWLPANLIHDRHPITLVVEVVGGPADQRVISNGPVVELGPARWQVEFPASSAAQSPMLVLIPGARVESSSTTISLPDGDYGLELHRRIEVAASSAALHELLAKSFASYATSTGGYAYPGFTAVVGFNGGMEYDGGTTSAVEALSHELFHSWYGRGIRPARASDGWFDEAWNEYNTGFPLFPAGPIEADAPPGVLCTDNPWSRTTPYTAYVEGKAVFAAIADAAGVEPLRASMGEFYAAHVLELASTAELERHLFCSLGASAVREVFHRHVYGKQGAAAAVPDGYCEG